MLTSWKEIANHFGKSVRTVQRWEREMGLPIRRPRGVGLGTVLADQQELTTWFGAQPLRHSELLDEVETLRARCTELSTTVESLTTRCAQLEGVRTRRPDTQRRAAAI